MNILIIGTGKMGLSIIASWNRNKLSKSLNFYAVDKSKNIRSKVKKSFKNIIISEKIPENWIGDLLILAIKPQVFSLVAKDILKSNIKVKTIMSIMAGIKIKTISNSLKFKTNIVRVMPNIASELGLGVNCVYHNKNINVKCLQNVKILLKELGTVYTVKNEKLLDAVTAISGSGPAYFFLFLLIFENIAREIGFNKKESRNLVVDTVRGSLGLVKNDVDIRTLIDSVTSKGGTTEAALKILEKNNKGLYELMKNAINSANKRAQQLSKVT